MNINSLNGVQNFSVLKNSQNNNVLSNPNFEEQKNDAVEQTKQKVNAQTILASYGIYSKEQEREEILKQMAEAKAKFIEELKNNLPSAEERYQEGLRRGVRGRFDMIQGQAIYFVKYPDGYVEHMWRYSAQAQELSFKIKLTKMTSEEIELYNKAVKVFEERNLPYSKNQLANLEPDELKRIANGEFANCAGEVMKHGSAHLFNARLRQGIDVDDTWRVILDEGFRTVKPLEHPQTVYRQVVGNSEDKSIEFINKLVNAKKGDTVSDKGYSYASYIRELATACHGTSEPGTPIFKLIIKVPEGAKVSQGKDFEQCEMLFPRNAEFRVVEEAKVTTPGYLYEASPGEMRKSGDTMEIVLEYVIPKT